MAHRVARPDAFTIGSSGYKFKCEPDFIFGADNIKRLRHRVFGDGFNAPVLPDEQNIERQICILHPHLNQARRLEIKQHTLPRRHRLAVHKTNTALAIIVSYFNEIGFDPG